MKRLGLFLLTNFLVVLAILFISSIVIQYYPKLNLNLGYLAIFSLIWGFSGSIISLLLSKTLAKKMYEIHIIKYNDPGQGYQELRMLVDDLSKKAGLKVSPEIGIYYSDEINAFATGPSKNRALVAFSSGLINSLNYEEIKGVVGHELAHVANGDMVTMTLLQGVVNSFVIFFARLIAGSLLKMDDNSRGFSYIAYFLIISVLEFIFMLFGSIVISFFSRWREYRADEEGGKLAGFDSMILALNKLLLVEGHNKKLVDNKLNNFKIFGKRSILNFLFSTHPSLKNRIMRLKKLSSL